MNMIPRTDKICTDAMFDVFEYALRAEASSSTCERDFGIERFNVEMAKITTKVEPAKMIIRVTIGPANEYKPAGDCGVLFRSFAERGVVADLKGDSRESSVCRR